MSGPVPLTYHGLVSGMNDERGPRLMLLTPSGIIREVPLTRTQLTSIIERAASALMLLDKEEARLKRANRPGV